MLSFDAQSTLWSSVDPRHLKKIPLLLFAGVWVAVAYGVITRNATWLLWMRRIPGGFFSLVLAIIVSAFAFAFWHQHRSRQGFEQLVGSTTWQEASIPAGLPDHWLETTATCPVGDRRRGCRYVAERDIEVVVDGEPVTVTLGAFQWWWEVRRRSRKGRTTYTRRGRVVGAVRLPVEGRFPPVAIGDESVFAKLGLGGRGDMQVESEEFNRRFRVQVAEQAQPVVVRLLDPAFQRILLDRFVGREVELVHDVLLLGGDPEGHDDTHFGPAGEYARLAEDVATVVGAVPDGFWRAMSPMFDESSPSWPERT